MWLLVLDSNWLVDRVQPVSNPGLRVTHSWGTSFLLGGFLLFRARARTKRNHKKEKPRIDTVTGITDTNFLSNATGNGDRKCIWQKDSVCVTGTFLSIPHLSRRLTPLFTRKQAFKVNNWFIKVTFTRNPHLIPSTCYMGIKCGLRVNDLYKPIIHFKCLLGVYLFMNKHWLGFWAEVRGGLSYGWYGMVGPRTPAQP